MIKKQTLWLMLLLIFLLAQAAIVFPLDPNRAIDKYINRIWTTKEGLPQNTVYAIVQDKDGYIWIGTDSGLARFDGINFRIFNTYNTDEIKNNSITSLYAASDGSLWIGTFGGGINLYRNGTFKHFSQEHGLANNFIWTINEDRRGNIWITTTGGGLVRYGEGKFKTYTVNEGLADNTVKAVVDDLLGRLWVGTEKGLCLMEKGSERFQVYQARDGLADDFIMALFVDSQDNLWIGTTKGLSRRIRGTFTTYTRRQGLCHNLIHGIFEDREKNLWIATEGGLNRLKGNRFERLTEKEGLSDNSLLAIFEDREGNLWIGTSSRGLNMLHDSKFTFYTADEGLSKNTIRAIYEDARGGLWIGTGGDGLNYMRNGKIRTYTTAHGLSSNFINSIYGDHKGRIWLGTMKGLNLFQGGVFNQLILSQKGLVPSVISLYEDKRKNLWIGTQGAGLYLYQRGKFRHFSSEQDLVNDFILSIAEDRDGHIWIGTNSGLVSIEPGQERLRTYSEKDGLSSSIIYDIHADASNILWLGTNGGGLNRMEKGKFTVFTTESGMFSNVIYRILEDDKGNLWMSSNQGIFTVVKRELNKFAGGEIDSVECSYFQEDDGMRSSVCCGGFQPAGWQARDGTLYFPTNQGVAAIHPKKVKLNQAKPPVNIERVLANGREIEFHKKSKLPPKTRRIEIHFTALSFTAPEKVRFSYRLFGFEDQWQEPRSRQPAVYTGLRPGNYRFRVIAGNNDNIWNYQGDTYSFSITYSLFQRIFFRLTLFVILLFLAILLYQTRKTWLTNKLEKGKKYRGSTLEPWKSRQYLHKIITLMEKEKPFLDPEITVEKLGKMLDLPEKHLSQILNEQFDQNFNNFINKYRVEEAKKKLLDPKEQDFVLLKIAFDVGFNSKSVFNAAFKKFTGLSPSEYRKMNRR